MHPFTGPRMRSLLARDSHGRPLPVQDDAALSPFAP